MAGCRHLFAAAAILAVLAAWSAGGAPAPDDPVERLQAEAYLAVIDADTARDREEWRNAIRWYRNAATLYEAIRRSDPEWHPDVIQYRLSYCANEINWILQETGKTEKQLLAGFDEPPAAPTNATAAVNEALTKENELLRAEIDRLNADLQARPVVESWEAEVRRWRGENAALAAQLAALSNRLAAATHPSVREVKELKRRNEQLEEQLRDAGRQAEDLRKTVERQAGELKKIPELNARADALAKEKTAVAGKAEADLKAARKQAEELKAVADRAVAQAKEAQEIRARSAKLAEQKDALDRDGQKARADLEQSEKRVAALLATLDRQGAELKKLDGLRAQIDKLSAEKAALDREGQKARADLEQSEKRAAALLATVDRQGAELKKLDGLRAQIGKLEAEKEALDRAARKAKEDLASALEEKRVKKLEELVTKLRADLKDAEANAEMLQVQLARIQQKAVDLEKENARLKRK